MLGFYLILAGAGLVAYEIVTEIYERRMYGQNHKDGGSSVNRSCTDGKSARSKKFNRNRSLGAVISDQQTVVSKNLKAPKITQGDETNETVIQQVKPDPLSDSSGHDYVGEPDGSAGRNHQEQGVKEENDGIQTDTNHDDSDNGRDVSEQSVSRGNSGDTEASEGRDIDSSKDN